MVTENRVLMIIKGLFRRYERWNPVHPTSGAFWGMGIGIGCGVGWGPGFGPEVVGYVGAGCGIGFSVGITLAGIGIGLPANFLLQIPYNLLEGARTGALDLYRCWPLPAMRNDSGAGWNPMSPLLSGMRKEAGWKIPSLNLHSFNTRVQLNEMKNQLANQANSALVCVGAFKNCVLLHGKGKKEDPSR